MAETKISQLREQRADLVPTADELRKGVNVLTTSDPRNPAKNPFVQQQSTQSKNSNNGSKSDKK
jgi:hypothetical protein